MASVERGGGKEGGRRRVWAEGGNVALSFPFPFLVAFFSVNENRQWATSRKQDLEQGGKRKDLRSLRQQARSVPQLGGGELDGKSRKALG